MQNFYYYLIITNFCFFEVLINISSDGTVIGQALTKTAFAVTLLRMCHASTRSRFPWQQALLWFCIVSMDGIALAKCVFQWAKMCERHDYQQWYRINGWCLDWTFAQDFKEVGNSELPPDRVQLRSMSSGTNFQSTTSSWTSFSPYCHGS